MLVNYCSSAHERFSILFRDIRFVHDKQKVGYILEKHIGANIKALFIILSNFIHENGSFIAVIDLEPPTVVAYGNYCNVG